MPRFVLTDDEKILMGQALLIEARTRGLSEQVALAEVALTTMAELKALLQNRLLLTKTDLQTQLAGVDAAAVARKAGLTTEIAAIDSALAKL